MNASKSILHSALACLVLSICSCATTPNENRHSWNIEIVPANENPGALALMVQYQHSEHRGSSKGGLSSRVVASPGEGRETDSAGFGINSARYNLEAGLKVFWIDEYRVKAEYDARYRVTGINNRLYQDQSVKGATEFYVEEGRPKRNLEVDGGTSSN